MAIIFDTRLEAARVLRGEGFTVLDQAGSEALSRDPLRVCVLNLLPEKPEAETQWLRGLACGEQDVAATFFMVEGHRPTHTPPEYLWAHYRTPTDLREETFDGMIVTGADVERFAFESLRYWQELEEIFTWADSHVRSCWFSCWGAMAALYHYHGIRKYLLGGKISGIYDHAAPHPDHPLMAGIQAPVSVPHSRISGSCWEEIRAAGDLTVLAESEKAGPAVLCDDGKRHVFTLGHWEYEPWVLGNQYRRDVSKGYAMQKPENYFDADGAVRQDHRWMGQFQTMMKNWLGLWCARED